MIPLLPGRKYFVNLVLNACVLPSLDRHITFVLRLHSGNNQTELLTHHQSHPLLPTFLTTFNAGGRLLLTAANGAPSHISVRLTSNDKLTVETALLTVIELP